MRDRTRRSGPSRGDRFGFTLIELLVVMAIIGILISLILRAAMDGARRAEERATQGLIAKLDSAMADRLQSLLLQRRDPTPAHTALAAIYYSTAGLGNPSVAGYQRAQVLANFDYIKAEIPDVFYFPSSSDPDFSTSYPINFGATAWDGNSGNVFAYMNPIDLYQSPFSRSVSANGVYGASFTARGALYKNLTVPATATTPAQPMAAAGFDGTDNNGDGLIDDSTESGFSAAQWTAIATAHQHKTARAEMLYALLVEGQGPFGAAFNADDFSDREVRDTDGDGLPEFVDAWGEPLQFYRWPVFFHSDLQRGVDLVTGSAPYASVFESREQDPLDPNQTIMAQNWYYNTTNLGPGLSAPPSTASTMSPSAWWFHCYFHPIVEPQASSPPSNPGFVFWDRSGGGRRAFYSKFLIASSGPDRQLGIARLDMFGMTPTVRNLWLESQARQGDLNITGQSSGYDPFCLPVNANVQNPVTQDYLATDSQDDITNHNLQAPGGGIQ